MNGMTVDVVSLIRGLAELAAAIAAIIAAWKARKARNEAQSALETIRNIVQQQRQTQSVTVPVTVLVGKGETFPIQISPGGPEVLSQPAQPGVSPEGTSP